MASPRGSSRWARAGVVVALLVLWEVWTRAFGDPLFVSPPSLVAAGLIELSRDQAVWGAIGLTFWELIAGFAGSLVIGVVGGIAIGIHRLPYRSLYPIVLLAYAIPQSTILPLFVLSLGTGAACKIAYGVSHGMFPIMISVIGALRNVRPEFVAAAWSMGATRRQVLRRVILPSIVPGLFTGMRLGMSATLLGVLLAELYVTSGGIGFYTNAYTQTFQPHLLFALTAVLATMAIILNEAARKAEVHHSRWSAGQ